MAQRIRGQETTFQIIIDGDLKNGTFAKVETAKHTPRTDLVDADFLGEKESDTDIQHHNHEVTFTVHEADHKALDVLKLIINRERDGLPHPAVTIVETVRYRDPSIPNSVRVFNECVIKQDEHNVSGRKEYVKNSYTARCKVMD
jgi:hypothetical protein